MVETEVLVVGAGPTGLMAACWLARLGADVRLIDPKPGPTRESRAIVMHARSMEILDQLGVADQVEKDSYPVDQIAPGYGRRRFGSLPLGQLGVGLTPYPRLTVFEQSKTEALLGRTLTDLGGSVSWGHALTSVSNEPDAVVCHVQGPDGAYEVRARYVIGCDGGGSELRGQLALEFSGVTNPYTFFVCDAVGVEGLRESTVNMRFGDEEFLLTFPLTGTTHHRLIGTVPSSTDLSETAVRLRAERTFGVRWQESAWFSTYRVHHRVTERFRYGRCFLAGDAAHVHSPVGAQGMNTGLQDAHNLALALVDVLRRGMADSSLDRYERERRPVALRLVATTDRLFALVTSRRPVPRLLRRIALPVLAPLALRLAPSLPIGARMFGYLAQIRIHYWMSESARSRGRRDRVVGRRLPWTGYPTSAGASEDNHHALRAIEWQVHTYGAVTTTALAVARRCGLPVVSFASTGRSGLRRGLLYLVRPDGFVAAAAVPAEATAVFGRIEHPRSASNHS